MLRSSLLLTLISLGLLGCTNINESQCLNADWNTIGFEDGLSGRNEAQISQHRKDCAEHGVLPNLAEYRAGHVTGSERFCTSANGFKQGLAGRSYARNCPQQLEPQFLLGFNDGQTLYGLKKVLQQNTEQLEKAYVQIGFLEQQIVQKREWMIADGFNREQRKTIGDAIEVHQLEQGSLGQSLPQFKQQLDDSLELYESALASFTHHNPN
jgi:hypothetical protein